jgi:hypothetical protein
MARVDLDAASTAMVSAPEQSSPLGSVASFALRTGAVKLVPKRNVWGKFKALFARKGKK